MHNEPGFFAEPRNWVVLAFILFFVLFGRKLWAALAGLLDARAVAVKGELEEAARLRREAESMLRDAEKQRADALSEARALIEGARAEAGRVSAAAAAEAEASAKRREQMAIERIAAAEKAAVADVRLAAADVATNGRASGACRRSDRRCGSAADRPRDHAVAGGAGSAAGRLRRRRGRPRVQHGGRLICRQRKPHPAFYPTAAHRR